MSGQPINLYIKMALSNWITYGEDLRKEAEEVLSDLAGVKITSEDIDKAVLNSNSCYRYAWSELQTLKEEKRV